MGEADPHADVWLLDDPVAVREALELQHDVIIPNVSKSYCPKEDLNALIGGSKYRDAERMATLSAIARYVNKDRSVHREETGFARFVEEVKREFIRFWKGP